MFTIPTLIISIVVFLIGLALGSIVEGGLKKKQSVPKAAPAEPAQTTSPSETDNLAQAGDVNVFNAWRTSADQVWLEMDGQRLENKEAMQPEQYQRLLKVVLDLRPWLKTNQPTATVSSVPSEPSANASTAPSLAPNASEAAQKGATAAIEEAKPAPVNESIIQQINRILQEKLTASVFKGRGIQLVEGPGGIVMVWDGANKYEGVDGIPDPQIKSLIQQAVSEWEKGAR